MKNIKFILLLLFAFVFLPINAEAAEFKEADNYIIAEDEELQDDLFIGAQSITINGTLDGDLFAAANDITINGEVTGSVFTGASSVSINGIVGNDLYVGAGTVSLGGQVGDNMYIGAGTVSTKPDFIIERDAFIGAGNFNFLGEIGRNLFLGAGGAVLDGVVSGNVYAEIDSSGQTTSVSYDSRSGVSSATSQGGLTIGRNAQINGNLEYRSPVEAEVERGANIKGKTQFDQITAQSQKQNYSQKDYKTKRFTKFGFMKFTGMLGLILVALLFVAFFKEKASALNEIIVTQKNSAFGNGILFLIGMMFIGFPILVMLFFTMIGAPLALIIVALVGIALYMSKVVAAIYLGRITIRAFKKEGEISWYWSAALGALLLSLLVWIPFVGWIIKGIAQAFGIGAIILHMRKKREGKKTGKSNAKVVKSTAAVKKSKPKKTTKKTASKTKKAKKSAKKSTKSKK